MLAAYIPTTVSTQANSLSSFQILFRLCHVGLSPAILLFGKIVLPGYWARFRARWLYPFDQNTSRAYHHAIFDQHPSVHTQDRQTKPTHYFRSGPQLQMQRRGRRFHTPTLCPGSLNNFRNRHLSLAMDLIACFPVLSDERFVSAEYRLA